MKRTSRRTILKQSVVTAALISSPSVLRADSWPSKPIRWVIPYPPGGLTDSATRMVLSRIDLGQPIVFDNKPGANALIGTEIVAKAAPDGYTFLTVIAAHAINKTFLAGKLGFDPQLSFVPVSLIGIAPTVLLVTNSLPVTNVAELIAYAKANPNKLSYGSSGVGSAGQLTVELLKQATGIQMENVSYKGSAQALADLSAGNIQVLVDSPISVISSVRGGKIRALAMLSKQRVKGVEEIPTVIEAGGPPIESSSWAMFLAPAGTPTAIVDRLSGEIRKVMADPELLRRFVDLALVPVGSSPDEAAKFLAAEVEKWGKVITVAGVKPEM